MYIKHYLFKKLADFPKPHFLKELLIDIGNAYQKQNEVAAFIKENEKVIFDLEQAYISSCYLPVEFYESQIKEMEKFIEILFAFLEKL